MQSSVVAALTWSKSHLLKPSIHESTACNSGEGFSGMGARSYNKGAIRGLDGDGGKQPEATRSNLRTHSVHAVAACSDYCTSTPENILYQLSQHNQHNQTLLHYAQYTLVHAESACAGRVHYGLRCEAECLIEPRENDRIVERVQRMLLHYLLIAFPRHCLRALLRPRLSLWDPVSFSKPCVAIRTPSSEGHSTTVDWS